MTYTKRPKNPVPESLRAIDEQIQALLAAVREGKRVYISGRQVSAIEIVPTRRRYKVAVVFEDGSTLVEYPSLLVKRHIVVEP